MKRFVRLSLSFFLLTLFVPHVSAEGQSVMPYPQVQHIYPADPNGDTGTFNCMAASLTSALRTIRVEHELRTPQTAVTYAEVRTLLRHDLPPEKGIPPALLIAATSVLTDTEITASLKQLRELSYQQVFLAELKQGLPIIAHVSDKDMLYEVKKAEESSHVVVVYGIDSSSVSIMDPWDGGMHAIPHEVFHEAFYAGKYPGWYFTFTVQKPEVTFASILATRRSYN